MNKKEMFFLFSNTPNSLFLFKKPVGGGKNFKAAVAAFSFPAAKAEITYLIFRHLRVNYHKLTYFDILLSGPFVYVNGSKTQKEIFKKQI